MQTPREFLAELSSQTPIYFIKLVNGDSIIGKSDDDTSQINTVGYIAIRDTMKVKMQLAQLPSGEMTEILLIMPWLEGCSITEEVTLPIDTIIVIAQAKPRIADKYLKLVVGYKIQEQAETTETMLDEMQTDTEGNDVPVHDTAEAEAAKEVPSMLQPNIPPRTPELLSRDRMIEAEENGEIEDPAPQEPAAEPKYKVRGRTVH